MGWAGEEHLEPCHPRCHSWWQRRGRNLPRGASDGRGAGMRGSLSARSKARDKAQWAELTAEQGSLMGQ